MTKNNETALLADVKKVAEMLDVSVATIWRLVKRGQLAEPVKVGGATRWRMSDVMALVEGEAA